jgi:hypothetical protein
MISLVFISIDKMEEREERTRGIMAKRWKWILVDLLPRRKAILESIFDGSLALRSSQSIGGRHDDSDIFCVA